MSSFDKRAYEAGAQSARQRLGMPARATSAADMAPAPQGESHLHADRLAKMLVDLPIEYTGRPGTGATPQRLNRPTRWGSPTSLEASPSHSYAGMSNNGV